MRKRFEAIGYNAYLFDKSEDAVVFLKEYAANKTVGIGGSMTVKEMNLYPALKQTAKEIYSHWESGRSTDVYRNAQHAQLYFLSANGVSEDGEIVNIDGNGNRVGSSVFGPDEVIFVIGRNKIVPTLADAINRAKNIAAPLNAKRLGKNTPCAIAESCVNCDCADSFCCVTSIHSRKPSGIKATVILINEDLGF